MRLLIDVGGQLTEVVDDLEEYDLTAPTARAVLLDEIEQAWIRADPCPMTSAITGARCELPNGHPMYSATRFHKFSPPKGHQS